MHVARFSPAGIDQRVRLHGVSWNQYESLLAMRGESAIPRISFLEGEVELMSPSNEHEEDKKRLARLVEAWSEEAGIDLTGVGSWTIKKKLAERGAEPDECYLLTARHKSMPRAPDIAIEVVRTSSGLDKLEIYRLLGVREVGFWEEGALSFHVLRGKHYVRSARSTLLPSFDADLVARLMRTGTQADAVRALRRATKKKRR